MLKQERRIDVILFARLFERLNVTFHVKGFNWFDAAKERVISVEFPECRI